ncbi:hypothetical protein L6452_21800 [Arctium lappa]|uniref:Uncharacterized protein n=1 Tax=Arctium lappa TaxID=4217 RepID=A0ACB9AYY0_ARCLA|nr:hypothetical protein L6452_21800 [Arctium lappa]
MINVRATNRNTINSSEVRSLGTMIDVEQCDGDEWEEFFKGHPKAKTLKTSPLAFPELCIALFEGTSATGSRVYAPSSTRERTVSSSITSHGR